MLVHPFDHPDIVAGQGTVGLEILEQVPDVRTVVVCTGGGGLLAGIALAVKSLRPDVRVVGVQAESAAAFPASLAAGHPVPLDKMATMADGIAVGCPGTGAVRAWSASWSTRSSRSPRSRCRARCCSAWSAPSSSSSRPGPRGWRRLLDAPRSFQPPVAVVLSGGNIDPLLLMRVLRHGLAVAGRFLSFRARISDQPGALVQLLAEVAEAGASVLEVEHMRTDPGCGSTRSRCACS